MGGPSDDETSLVEMRIWCIKIGIVLTFHCNAMSYNKKKIFAFNDHNISLGPGQQYCKELFKFIKRVKSYGRNKLFANF